MSLKNKLVLLRKEDIEKKLNRLACQILENYTNKETIQLIGLNERGLGLAKLLKIKINKQDKEKQIVMIKGTTENHYHVEQMDKINPNMPIIVVDDVLNTGNSIYQLVSILAPIKPTILEICVLAHRHHRKLPIHANYVGLTIATTLHEHIFFDIDIPELYLQ